MKGVFIVIDGTDCTGKTTQAKMLIDNLISKGKDVKYLDFPTYEKTLGGKIVTWYLEGKFGSLKEVPPELACLTFALDRYQLRDENQQAYDEGKILIANRYTQSNFGHQGGKFQGEEREKFIKWIEDVESRMPQPDMVVYLDLPIEISQRLKNNRSGEKGAGKEDIHEKDTQHLKDARESYVEAARKRNWIIIDCKDKNNNDIRTREDIHQEILTKLKERLPDFIQ